MDPTIRPLIKRSKAELEAGRPEEAKLEAEQAVAVASSDKKRFGRTLPIAVHRLAMALKMLKDYEAAREQFELALATFDRKDRIGYTILLRDYGFFLGNELRDYGHGREKVEEAIRLLRGNFPPEDEERVKLELLATRSFLCRVRLRENRFDHAALDELVKIDKQLRELATTKPGYELDNLSWILRYEMRVKKVNPYLPRAIALSITVGNLKRVAEYTFMTFGGQYGRAGLNRFFS